MTIAADLPEGAAPAPRRAMFLLFLIVFISLMGFGIILPVFPFFGRLVGATAETITLAMAAYSLGQFLGAPLWGALSDRIGRRPVLVWSLIGSAISYGLLAYADTIFLLGATRLLSGLMAGNIAAAFAYVGDISTPETRAKNMGLLGAGFGLGFIFGPAIGGLIAGAESGPQDLAVIAFASTAITLVSVVMAFFALPESLPPERRGQTPASPDPAQKGPSLAILAKPMIVLLSLLVFIVIGSAALMETTFALFANDKFAWGPRSVGLAFALVGVVAAALQGGATGPIVKRMGEHNVVMLALVIYALGMGGLAVAPTPVLLLCSMGLTAAGVGLFSPSYNSLVASHTTDADRGVIMGITQAASSLGRVAGPAISGTLYVAIARPAPFLIGAALMLVALVVALPLRRQSTVRQTEGARP